MELCKCLICGKEFHYINNTHLKQHNLTIKEYMGKFPNSKTRSLDYSNKLEEKNKTKGIKISKYRLGKTYEEIFGLERAKEIKKKVSECHLGEKNYFYGKHLSDETKKRISIMNKGRKLKKPRSLEYRKKISEANRNRIPSEESKIKRSETLKRRYTNGDIIPLMLGKHLSSETKEKLSNSLKNSKKFQSVMKSKEYRENMSKLLSGKNNPMYGKFGKDHPHFGHKHTPESKLKMSIAQKGKIVSKETREKLSKLSKGKTYEKLYGEKRAKEINNKKKESWKKLFKEHPDYLKSLIRRGHEKPNNVEHILIDFFQQSKLPYKYVGNGEIIIGKKNPDFINYNGQKKIIELFGEHWHKGDKIKYNRTEKGTIEHYQQYGFDCLVIWNNDLIRNFSNIIQKIIDFDKQ